MDNVKKEHKEFIDRLVQLNSELNELTKEHQRNIKRIKKIHTEVVLLEHKAKVLFNA